MVAPGQGDFDHVVAMDSLIHYEVDDAVNLIADLAGRVRGSMVLTYAPRTPALALMHAVGQFFPRGDRSPAIVPVRPKEIRRRIEAHPALAGWRVGREQRITRGFYTSQALELIPA
jgi:magnesium-protoporphyrin O-methyltransferase